MYTNWPVRAKVRKHFRWYEVRNLMYGLNGLAESLVIPEKLKVNDQLKIQPIQEILYDQHQRFPENDVYFCDCQGFIIELIGFCNKIIDLNEKDELNKITFNDEGEEEDGDDEAMDEDEYNKLIEKRNDYANQAIACIQNLFYTISNGYNTFDQLAFEEYFSLKWS